MRVKPRRRGGREELAQVCLLYTSSNSGKTRAFRRALVEKSPAMIGTVPMYDAIGYLEKALIAITPEDFLEVVRAHAEDGVDFVTIHRCV